jgi:hypothetical protein
MLIVSFMPLSGFVLLPPSWAKGKPGLRRRRRQRIVFPSPTTAEGPSPGVVQLVFFYMLFILLYMVGCVFTTISSG